MLLTRARQALDLTRPTARVVSWGPALFAAVVGLGYVALEAPGAYIDYRILVLRLAALGLALGAAFVLDDPTEETLGHVPTPLLLRRALRIALVLPLVTAAWIALVNAAGTVRPRQGGPLPVGDLTIEAATLLAVALCAACAGSRFTSDRLGGIVAAPVVLALVAAAMFLPADQKMILGSPVDVRWHDAHEWWLGVLAVSGALFLWLNLTAGARRTVARMRGPRRA